MLLNRDVSIDAPIYRLLGYKVFSKKAMGTEHLSERIDEIQNVFNNGLVDSIRDDFKKLGYLGRFIELYGLPTETSPNDPILLFAIKNRVNKVWADRVKSISPIELMGYYQIWNSYYQDLMEECEKEGLEDWINDNGEKSILDIIISVHTMKQTAKTLQYLGYDIQLEVED